MAAYMCWLHSRQEGDRIMKKTGFLLMVLILVLTMAGSALAAKKTAGLLPEDFAYKGLSLGATRDVMVEKLGEPDFDTDIVVLDQTVKCYVYSSDLKVCTDPRNDKVVAILCKDKDYKAREDVCYGSTRAKLKQVYGNGSKVKRDGEIYWVYRNPDDERQKLMLSMETTSFYVESFLITSLPLTEDEQAEYDLGEFPTDLSGDNEPKLHGGFSSKGEWWAAYKLNDHITIGTGN